MASVWQSYRAVVDQDSEIMATILEAKCGQYAAQVADFFASLHDEKGDTDCSGAWACVAERVRTRQWERTEEP